MLQIQFQIHYSTKGNEVVQCQFCTNQNIQGTVALKPLGEGNWSARLPLPKDTKRIAYSYIIVGEDGLVVRKEEGEKRQLNIEKRTLVLCLDTWFDIPLEAAFRHTAFAASTIGETANAVCDSTFQLQLYAPTPPRGYRWAIVGEAKWAGEWQIEKAQPLQLLDINQWVLGLEREIVQDTVYKYVLLSEHDPLQAIWEEGDNRRLVLPAFSDIGHIVQSDKTPTMNQLRWRGAGVVIPVFSLRSEESQGIGDFGDLSQFVAWASQVGMSAVQLLPINDTSATGTNSDSYPYNSISVFALHPLYLDLRLWKHLPLYSTYAATFKELNAQKELDYAGVFIAKMSFLRSLFESIGTATLEEPSYQAFEKEHRDWLIPYAVFCAFRDQNETANFHQWEALKAGDAFGIENYLKEHPSVRPVVQFYCFVQYLLFAQIKKVHEQARRQKVILKGDLPIGVNRHSVDAWTHPRLFHFNGQAGAPPDAFAVKGQNWGFPTYHWEEMERDGYAWWRRRLSVMTASFDAYRIDHVLGFFRIWEIPYEQMDGLLGVFRPSLPYSREEMTHFGFTEEVTDFVHPHLTKHRLEELASLVPNTAFANYFIAQGERYYLRSEVATQRKITERVKDEKAKALLLDVCTEVLFITDPQQRDCFHPRIAAQNTDLFRRLSAEQQGAFNRLHDHYFYVRHNEYWAAEAVKKLLPITQIESTTEQLHLHGSGMLPCAEDLGMVPASVKGVLEKLHILSLEIQRMPKQYGVRFDQLMNNPYYSVSTIATHDMQPLRLWWKEQVCERNAYWQEVLQRAGTAPTLLTPEECQTVITAHLASPSMLCLLAWQDWIGIDEALRREEVEEEQINVPANPNHYWGYRMHLTIEQLKKATEYNQKLQQLIVRSGR